MADKKVVFFDRDGVINVDTGYLHEVDQCQFVDGIFSLCAHLKKCQYELIMVTNQSGIARGLYDETQFWKLTDWMMQEFRNNGASFLDVYFCPHHPSFGNDKYKIDCNCRKPKSGMFLQAIQEHNIDIGQSWIIGDRVHDIEAALAAGIKKNILFNNKAPISDIVEHHICNLQEAIQIIKE